MTVPDELLIFGTLVGAAIAGVFALRAAMAVKSALKLRQQLLWLQSETSRALTQLNAEDETDVLAATQLLFALNEPQLALEAIRRLYQLETSSNPQIAKAAKSTLESILDVHAVKEPVGHLLGPRVGRSDGPIGRASAVR